MCTCQLDVEKKEHEPVDGMWSVIAVVCLCSVIVLGGIIFYQEFLHDNVEVVKTVETKIVKVPQPQPTSFLEREIDTTRMWFDEKNELADELGTDSWWDLPDTVKRLIPIYGDGG